MNMSLSPRPERLTTMIWSFGICGAMLGDMGERMRRFQRRNDAFELGAAAGTLQRLLVGGGEIFHAAVSLQPGMLRPDAGIIEARRNRMRLDDLAVVVLQQIGAGAMQHAGRALR